MANRYPIPAQETRTETEVANSRFVCTVAQARTVEDAQAFIKRIKAELSDASSHAYAYRVGFGSSITDGCNDGGEPNGTAGKPMLAVLQGCGLGDVAAVVTRYFGGTKLGTGGLVRAFAGALKATLDVLPKSERVERKLFTLAVPYALYEQTKRLAHAHHGEINHEAFAEAITLTLTFIQEDAPAFAHTMRDLSAGKAMLVQVKE